MKKKAVFLISSLLLSYPLGYTTGYAITEGEKLLFEAVYKLIKKYYELENRLNNLEEKVRKLEIKSFQSPFVSEGFIRDKYVVVANRLRIRKCPSFRCKVIGYFMKDEIVEKVSEYGVWFKVHSGGKKGWVHSNYLVPF